MSTANAEPLARAPGGGVPASLVGAAALLHAAEAEVSVIGGMLLDADAIPRALEIVDDTMFYRDPNRRTFRAMARIWERGTPIDAVTLTEELRSAGDFERVGGMTYLAEIWDAVPSAANLEHHARIVRDKAARRRLAEVLKSGLARTTDPESDLAAIAGEVRDGLELLPVTRGADPWPAPREIPSGLAVVQEFSTRLLPENLRGWIADISERMACPADFPGVAAVVALASVVGRRVTIRPMQLDDWTVTPNLWGAVIGRPGVLKSPAVLEALRPLKRLEVAAAKEYEEAVRQAIALLNVREIKRASIDKERIKKALKAGRSAEEIAAEQREEDTADVGPPRRRFMVNDATVERLAEILAENPLGTLVFRDELVGLLRSLEKEGREDSRAFYLESWNGDGRFQSDRIGRGSTVVESACLSLLGNIQPGPLRAYLRSAAADGGGADGLVQRFQLATWPDVAGEWRHVDRWRDTEARDLAFATFDRLASLDANTVGGASDRFEPDDPPFLRFDAGAQERFNAWRAELERRVRSGDEPPVLESHLAKYRSLIPSLALLFHLADAHTGAVGEAALTRALAWAQYLESHARRMYGAIVGLDTAPARALAKRIRAGDVVDGFTLRDVYRNQWSGLTTAADARAAVELLDALDWLRLEEEETGGRPKLRHRINPEVLR